MTDRFSRSVVLSCFGHVAIAMLIFLRTMTVPNEALNIRNAIRVDVVDLPKKIDVLPDKPPEPAPAPAPIKPPPPVPAPVAAVKKPEVVVPNKDAKLNTAKAEKNALSKLKALEAMEKFKTEMNQKHAAERPRAEAVAGNKVSAGNSITGLEKIEFDRYFDELESKIHSAWSIPQWLADADYKAQILVLIDERGYVIKKIFRKTSGNDIFDAKVIEAIDNSSPLPPPPQRLRGILSTSGIVFNFPQ